MKKSTEGQSAGNFCEGAATSSRLGSGRLGMHLEGRPCGYVVINSIYLKLCAIETSFSPFLLLTTL